MRNYQRGKFSSPPSLLYVEKKRNAILFQFEFKKKRMKRDIINMRQNSSEINHLFLIHTVML